MYISRSFFMQFYATKNLEEQFFLKRPKSIISNVHQSNEIRIKGIYHEKVLYASWSDNYIDPNFDLLTCITSILFFLFNSQWCSVMTPRQNKCKLISPKGIY